MTLTEKTTEIQAITLSELQEHARQHMLAHGFHFDGLLDTSGNRIDFCGRVGDTRKIEWYIASLDNDSKGRQRLQVTYNSHHDTLKSDKNYTFNSKTGASLNDHELNKLKARVTQHQQKRKEEEEKEERVKRRKAESERERFEKASINGHSPYLERKQVGVHGIRFEGDLLLIPMRDENGQIQALQEIYPEKRIFNGSNKPRDKNFTNATKYLYHTIGSIEDGATVYVGEGYSTCASVYESIGKPVVVAFSSGQLSRVIQILNRKYKDLDIVIIGDNDPAGKKAAELAAKECNYRVVFPEFPPGIGYNGKDFNDLMILFDVNSIESGKEEVKKQILENAYIPSCQTEIKKKKSKDKMNLNDDEDLKDEDNKDELDKARANARRRALMQQANKEDIVRDLCKQHPSIADKIEDIAEKAILWAKSFQAGDTVIVEGIPKTITNMGALDARFAQLEAPGQPCVTIHRSDAQPITSTDFNKRLSGEVVIGGVNEKGQPKYIAASAYWTGNTNKRVYRRIVFTNKRVDNDTYNLFTGLGIKPKEGNCDKILNHIKEVICADDEETYNAFLKLLAWQIQNIGRPSRVIVMLKSTKQQVGKGSLLQDILIKIYGNTGYQTSEMDQIIGRFNDTIRGKAYVYLDEALFSGNKKASDALKSLSTSTILGVETKGVPTVQLPIGINFFLSTNHEDAAFIEEDDVRYWILEASPHRAEDTSYFQELYKEIDGIGTPAFMHYLLNMDVSGFVPARDVPKDNLAKKSMIRSSINPYDARKWIEECCLSQMILGYKTTDFTSKWPWEPWIQGSEYANGIFYSAYTEWQKTVKSPIGPKPTPSNKFGEFLNKAGIDFRIQDSQRWRKLPDLNECLDKVIAMIEKGSKP